MLQRLLVALAEVKAASKSENLLNKIKENCLFLVSIKRNYYQSMQ